MPGEFQSQPDRGTLQSDRGVFHIGRIADALRGRRGLKRLINLAAILIPLIIGVVFIITSFTTRSQAALSSFVQAHGDRRAAVILSVDNIKNTSTTTTGSGSFKHTETTTSYTALVLVSLADPVGGQARTTVHVPGYETEGTGDTLTVLVDPTDPGYAELPGSPSTPADQPTIFLIVGASLIAVAIVLSVFIARKGTAFIDAILNARGFWGVSWHWRGRRAL